jgi:hypothetical protein
MTRSFLDILGPRRRFAELSDRHLRRNRTTIFPMNRFLGVPESGTRVALPTIGTVLGDAPGLFAVLSSSHRLQSSSILI